MLFRGKWTRQEIGRKLCRVVCFNRPFLEEEEAQVNVSSPFLTIWPFDVFRAAAEFGDVTSQVHHRKLPYIYRWRAYTFSDDGMPTEVCDTSSCISLMHSYSQVMILWHATAAKVLFCFSVFSVYSFSSFDTSALQVFVSCSSTLFLSFWLIDHKDDHRQRSDRSVSPLHYFGWKTDHSSSLTKGMRETNSWAD